MRKVVMRFIGLNLRHSGKQASVKVGFSAYFIYVFIYECISNKVVQESVLEY